MSAHVPVTVKGFTVICLKISEDKPGHYIYLKEHNVREKDPTQPSNKTLLAVNVPPYCDEDCLRRIFAPCGKVVHVHLQDKPTSSQSSSIGTHYFPIDKVTLGFKVAYIVFKNISGVKNACKLSYSKPLILCTPEHSLVTGLEKWCKQYADQKVDIKELQTEIDEYMTKFDATQQEATQQQKDKEGVADDEGWVTVTRIGKNKGAPRTEARKTHLTKRQMRRKRETELLNFYAFQFKETKKDQIEILRKKFEEDKQKIAEMKAKRKFKPY